MPLVTIPANAPLLLCVSSRCTCVQTDFTGSAGFRGSHFYLQPWNNLTTVTVQGSGTGGYGYYAFPAGYSAHWVRFVTDAPANVTAWLTYT